MIRPVTCICALLAGGSGLFLYQAKHRTLMLDRQIERTLKDIEATRAKVGILQAEWALLNSPERLAQLGDRFLALKPVTPTQFVTLADLDQRLPPPQPVIAQAGGTTDQAPAPNQAKEADAASPAEPAPDRAKPAEALPAAPAASAVASSEDRGSGQPPPTVAAPSMPAKPPVQLVSAHRVEPRHERGEHGLRHQSAATEARSARHDPGVRREPMERHRATRVAEHELPARRTRAVATASVARPPVRSVLAAAEPHARVSRTEHQPRLIRPVAAYAPERPASPYPRTPPLTGSLLGGVHAAVAPPVPVTDVSSWPRSR